MSCTPAGCWRITRRKRTAQERVDNLQELINAADGFLRETEREIGEGGDDPLMSFLSHAALEAGETQAAEGRPALQLMTVHSAKGLEFHTVFVTGLEEGLFPHENSMSEFDGIEEERRLAYVAITRARRRLYLTHAQSRMLHGQLRYNVASRFLDEFPDGLVQWLSARRRDFTMAEDAPPMTRVGRARGARLAHRTERQARQVRPRHHHRCRRPRRRRAGAGQFPRSRRQVARARVRQAAAGLTSATQLPLR